MKIKKRDINTVVKIKTDRIDECASVLGIPQKSNDNDIFNLVFLGARFFFVVFLYTGSDYIITAT